MRISINNILTFWRMSINPVLDFDTEIHVKSFLNLVPILSTQRLVCSSVWYFFSRWQIGQMNFKLVAPLIH